MKEKSVFKKKTGRPRKIEKEKTKTFGVSFYQNEIEMLEHIMRIYRCKTKSDGLRFCVKSVYNTKA